MSSDQNENPEPTDNETEEPLSPSENEQPAGDALPEDSLRLVVDDDGRGKESSYCLNIFVGEELIGLIGTNETKAKLCAVAFQRAGVPVKLSWTHR